MPRRSWRPAWRWSSVADGMALLRETAWSGYGAFWALLAVVSLAGMLDRFDAAVFDGLARALRGPSPDAVAVVALQDGGERGALARRLSAAGARAVVDATPPLSAREAELARQAGGDACQPTSPDGIVRWRPVRDDAGRACPWTAMLQAAGLPIPRAARVSPDWSVPTSTGIPRVRDVDARSATTLGALVRGRTVLLASPAGGGALTTPLRASDGPLEPAVVEALAVDAVARGRAIAWWPPAAGLGLAVLVALLLHAALRRTTYRATLVAAVVAIAPLLLLLALLLHLAHVHVPGTAPLLAVAGFIVRTLVQRNRTLGEALVDVDQRLTGLVQHPLHEGFELDAATIWNQANHFVTQFFDLRRSVMLALPVGATHMRVVAVHGCTEADIREMRRDYRRAPYATALARELPTQPTRPFLPDADGFVEFIAPLVAADQVVGFWGFSVAADNPAVAGTLAQEAGRYAQELAKLVLRVGEEADAPAAPRRWTTLARLRARLADGVTQAREQLAAHRDVFAAVGHPVAVLDMFGRVQFTNPPFEHVATALGKPLLAMTVTNMLEQLCGLPEAEAKRTLRQLVLGAEARASFPIASAELRDSLLVLRPVRQRTPGADPGATPFNLLGLILEIESDTRSAEAAVRLARAASTHAQRSGSRLQVLAQLVETLDIGTAAKARLTDELSQAIGDWRQLRQQVEAIEARDDRPASVAVATLLRRARHACVAVARAKDVAIHLGGRLELRVAVHERVLAELLDATLTLLVEDAAPGSAVDVECSLADDFTVRVTMSNDGFALPPAHVDDAMRAPRAAAPGEAVSALEAVSHAASHLDASTRLQVGAELGRGYRVSITLPRTHWSP